MRLIFVKFLDAGIEVLPFIMIFWLQALIKGNEGEIERYFGETELLACLCPK